MKVDIGGIKPGIATVAPPQGRKNPLEEDIEKLGIVPHRPPKSGGETPPRPAGRTNPLEADLQKLSGPVGGSGTPAPRVNPIEADLEKLGVTPSDLPAVRTNPLEADLAASSLPGVKATPNLPRFDEATRKNFIAATRAFRGEKYVWGGCTPGKGLDCSGLVTNVYRRFGLQVPRTAAEQYKAARKIPREELEVGDLVFFQNTGGRKGITHVGIYLGDNRIAEMSTGSKRYVETDLDTPYHIRHLAGFGTFRDRLDKLPRVNQPSATQKQVVATQKRGVASGKPEAPRSEFVRNYKGPKLSDKAVQEILAWRVTAEPHEGFEELMADVRKAHPGWNPDAVRYAWETMRFNKDAVEKARKSSTPLTRAREERAASRTWQAAGVAMGPGAGVPPPYARRALTSADKERVREAQALTQEAQARALAGMAAAASAPTLAIRFAASATAPKTAALVAGGTAAGVGTTSGLRKLQERQATSLAQTPPKTAPETPGAVFMEEFRRGVLQSVRDNALYSGRADVAAEITAALEGRPRSVVMEELEKTPVTSPAWWRLAAKHWGSGLIGSVAQQLGRQYPELLGSVVGTLAPGAAGVTAALKPVATGAAVRAGVAAGALGELGAEKRATFSSMLTEAGVDLSDPTSIRQFLSNTPAVDRFKAEAQKRGIAVAATNALLDALGGGVIEKAFKAPGGSVARKVAGTAVASAMQPVSEAAGEAAGKIAEGKNPLAQENLNDIILEGVLGGITGQALTASQTAAAAVGQLGKAAAGGIAARSAERVTPPVPPGQLEQTQSGRWRVRFEDGSTTPTYKTPDAALEKAGKTPAGMAASLSAALKATPGLEDISVELGKSGVVTLRTPGGASALASILPASEVEARAGGPREDGTRPGAFTEVQPDGSVALYLSDDFDIGELTHEVVHWMRTAGILSAEEINALAEYGRKKYGLEYSRDVPAEVEEAAAYAMQQVSREAAAPAGVGRVVSRVVELFRGLLSPSYRSGASVAHKFVSGHVANRPGGGIIESGHGGLLIQQSPEQTAPGIASTEQRMASRTQGDFPSPQWPEQGPYIGSINTDYWDPEQFENPDDVKKALRKFTDTNIDIIQRQRRGVQPHEVTLARARLAALGFTPARISSISPGTAANAETIVALDMTFRSLAKEVEDAKRAYAASRSEEDRIKLRRRIEEWAMAVKALNGLKAEAGRSLEACKIMYKAEKLGPEERKAKIARMLYDLEKEGGAVITDEELEQLVLTPDTDTTAMYRILTQAVARRAKIGSRAHVWLYSSMLSSVMAHASNIYHNTFVLTLERALVRPVATAVDTVASALTGRERSTYWTPALTSAARQSAAVETVKQLGDALRAAEYTARYGFLREQVERLDMPHGAREFADITIKGKQFTHPLNYPLRALAAEDAFFRSLAANLRMNELLTTKAIAELKRSGKPFTQNDVAALVSEYKANLDMHPDVLEKSASYVDRILQTRRGDLLRKLNTVIGHEVSWLGGFAPGKLILPFVTVPVNLAATAIEFTPAGGIKALATGTDVMGRPLSKSEQMEAVARSIVGTTVFLVAHTLAQSGALEAEGEPPDREGVRDLKYAEGIRPWSVRIGDRWYSSEVFGPFAALINAAIATAQRTRPPKISVTGEVEPQRGVFEQALRGFIRSSLEMSFLQGLDTTLKILSEAADVVGRRPSAMERLLAANASTLVPYGGLLRNIANATDPWRRETRSYPEDTTMQRILRRVATGIPGVRQLQPVALDALGRPVRQRPTGWAAFARMAGWPAAEEDPVARELIRLNVAPAPLSGQYVKNGVTYTLPAPKIRALQAEFGGKLRSVLEQTMQGDTYRNASDEKRVRILETMIGRVFDNVVHGKRMRMQYREPKPRR